MYVYYALDFYTNRKLHLVSKWVPNTDTVLYI